MTASIVQGTTVTYDYSLSGSDGSPFSLGSCTISFVAVDSNNATVLTHTLELDAFGVPIVAIGMTAGTETGTIVQLLSASTTAGLPVGRLTWKITLTDSTGAVSTPLRGSWVVLSSARPLVSGIATGPTRAELRKRIAQNLGDYRSLEATSGSAGHAFVDSLNVSSAAEDFAGCQVVVTSGANAGHVARVQSTNSTLNQLTLVPAASNAFVAGDTMDVVMRRGRGWEVREYHQAINDAIHDAYPMTMAELMVEAIDFSVETGRIVVPPEFLEIYAVEWQDSDGHWHPLPKAQRTGGWGWKADVANGTIVVTDSPKYLADGQPVRLYGYGKHPDLRAEGDRTDVNAEWLTARASYYLCRGGMDRDPQRGSLILLFERESAALRPRLRMLRKGATARVRPA